MAEGIAVTHSSLWAAPLLCLLFVAVAIDIPLVPFVGLTLLVRALTDDLAPSTARHSGSLDLSALIAGLFILLAIGLLIRRRRGLWPAVALGLWLTLWTGIAALSRGASTETFREGVREMSIVALAVIAYNAPRVLTISAVTRMVQLAGIIPALVALHQVATHTGQLVGGNIRSNGTFAQPNDAAVYFAIATTISLWRYLDNGRRRSDGLLIALFAAATITTFSVGGLATLLVMLIAFGLLRPGSIRLKLNACAVASLVLIIFFATPLGAKRLAADSSTNLADTHTRHALNNSLEWRFYKWQTLIPEWEKAPIFGQGLGTTITTEATTENNAAGLAPHSEYVRYTVETGAVGLAILIWGVVLLIRRLARPRIDLVGASGSRTLGLALAIGLLVNAIAANTLLYTPAAYAAALVIGTILALPVMRPLARRV